MALTKATYSLIEGAPVNVLDFGALGDGATDDTSAIQAAVDAALASGLSVRIPAGTYKITGTINVNGNIRVLGDGRRNTTLALYSADTSTYALSCSIGDNTSVQGLEIGCLNITCDNGAAKGRGIYLATTATNSAISQSLLHDVTIRNCHNGVDLYGVVYMSTFRNVTVIGTDNRGWRANPISGQILYNTFQDLEVTAVADNAYAYYMVSPSCHFKNLTADGCSYFDGAYLCIDGYAVEGITATTPASNYAIECHQVMSVRNVDIINVPTAKCQYGISVESPCFSLSGVRIPDSGAGNQPNRVLNLYTGNTGTISDIQCDLAVTNKLEAYLSDAILNGFVLTGCGDITDRGLSYLQGTWTPTFPANWSVSPTTVSAQYTKIGRQVTVTFYGTGGTALANAQIGGLPFAANATQGAGAAGGNSDSTEAIRGSILPGESIIKNIPALTLTGDYWQITATYFT